MSDWEIVLVRPNGDEALWKQCIDVRLEVFAKEQGFPVETEIDHYDKDALQFLLRHRETLEPMGVVRLNPPPTLKLARLAVLPAFRGKGHAERLVQTVHNWVLSDLEATKTKADQKTTVWLNAQLPVKRFYSKIGYVSIGDEFDEEGAPHQRMEISLPIDKSV